MAKDMVILNHFVKPLWSEESKDKRFIVLQGGAGSGKSLSLDTLIHTPKGPVMMQDIEIGDEVCDTLGGVCTVLNKWDNRRTLYEIALEDGRKICAADHHNWDFMTQSGYYTGTTTDLIMALNETPVFLPLTDPVYRDNEDEFYPDALATAIVKKKSLEEMTFLFGSGVEEFYTASGRFRCIPTRYLNMTVADRVSFIATLTAYIGIYDSTTQNIILPYPGSDKDAKKVQKIIWSIGGKCLLKFNNLYRKYTLYFDFDNYAVKEDILDSWDLDEAGYVRRLKQNGVRVASITIKEKERCQCIEVDSPNHLYLANDYIVTHNSEAICQRLAYMFLELKDMVFAVVRAQMPALTRSVYLGDPSITKSLRDYGVPVDKWLNKTENTLRNPLNGSVMYFIGLDDPEKIKSMNLNYVFIEEATDINADKWSQLNTRLRRANPYGKNQMFLAYNPISYYNWVVQMFVVNPDPLIKDDTIVHFSNFTQNPYVAMENVKSMLARAAHDEAYYRTYVIGRPGKPLGLIYPNIIFTPSSTWPKELENVKPYYGIDWGYVDPTVLVECRDYDNKIYVRCLFYETKKHTSQFFDWMDANKISKLSNIYYDSADAERGNLLLQRGYTAFKAKKNINAGISYVKGFDIIVDSEGKYSQFAMDEVQGYTWQTDPDDSSKFIEKPVEGNDHFCDSLRYAVVTEHVYQRKFGIAGMDLDVDTMLKKSGVYYPEEK